jgi:cysteine synthase
VIPLPTGHTPLVALCLLVDGIERMLRLKLESFNACGSIKDRTAHSLLDALGNRVDPALGVIESTSGNLGVAMAALCAARRLPFTAVVDPSTSAMLVMRMRRLGAHVVVIDEPDSVGCYLLSRLRYVKRELRRRPGLTWSDQYSSEANVRAHYHGTAAELWGQLPVPTTVCVAVSTGGTLAGFQRFVAQHRAPWRVVGVDVVGSVALGGPAGPRLLSGIGSSRRATLLEGDPDETAFVSSREAVSACLWLLDSTGIDVGGSSGAVIAAALRRLREDRDLVEVTCICPDGGDRYLSTVYSAQWRQRHGLAPVEELGHDVVLLDPPAKTTMVGERAGR